MPSVPASSSCLRISSPYSETANPNPFPPSICGAGVKERQVSPFPDERAPESMESLAPRKETWIRAEREGNDALPVAEAGDLGDRSFATSEPASDLKEEVKGFVYGRSGGVDGSGLDGSSWNDASTHLVNNVPETDKGVHFSQPFLVFGANK
nr:PREDICTED: uncharacterized protein LOC103975880 isoform X2 [Musa acuminata subsp. malaccensis]